MRYEAVALLFPAKYSCQKINLRPSRQSRVKCGRIRSCWIRYRLGRNGVVEPTARAEEPLGVGMSVGEAEQTGRTFRSKTDLGETRFKLSWFLANAKLD